MKDTIRIGMVVRADFTGLGNQSQDWVAQLPIAKVLVVWGQKQASPEIFKNLEMKICEQQVPSLEEINWLLEDIDLAITLETPYNWNLISEARKKGIKTIINPNYEWLPIDIPEEPDLWLCTNILNYETIQTENKIYLPQPINRDTFQFKKRKKARTFLFNNGNGGAYGRNGLREFAEAINFVKSDVKFIVNSQIPIEAINDKRVSARVGEQSLKDIWKEGDVFVHLRKFGAMSLPMNEAMSLGMPILGVNRNPENTYLPKELLVEPEGKYLLRCRDDVIEVEAFAFSPIKIAAKIDEWANKDISELSEKMNELAGKWDWNNWRDHYIETIYNLVNNLPLKNYEKDPVDIRGTVD
jgi:hypothetical protein